MTATCTNKTDLTALEDEKRRRARLIRRAGREPGTRWSNAISLAYLRQPGTIGPGWDAFGSERATALFQQGLTATEAAQVAARETPSAADLRSQVIWVMASMEYADLAILSASARHLATITAKQNQVTS